MAGLLVWLYVLVVVADAVSVTVQRMPHRQLTSMSSVPIGRPGSSIVLPGVILQFGEFYVEIGIGSPPQTFRTQLDTGSSTLTVFDQLCSPVVRHVVTQTLFHLVD
jgi:hypothetical protein